MRKIDKGIEPQSLSLWKARNPQGTYRDLTHVERQDIRTSCLKEQFYICAYCCQSITDSNNDSMNEHVEARKIAPHRSLDFFNIVASCKTPRQCDAAHDSQPLPLTPLMNECNTEFQFKLSGRVQALTNRAEESIRVLNLGDTERNNRSLIEKRKQIIQSILLTNGVDPGEGLDDDDLIQSVIDDISMPVNGKLESYSPVVTNVLRSWLV